MKSKDYLLRYTNFTALMYLLHKQKLSLLDPKTWSDKNDCEYLNLYKRAHGYKSVRALCLTSADETAHHWQAFGGGADGIRIEFHTDRLIECIEAANQGIVHGPVEYKKINELGGNALKVADMPFIKRYVFRGEEEYRLLHFSMDDLGDKTIELDLDLSAIRRIYFSNAIHKNLFKEMKSLISKIPGCSELAISQSTLNNNRKWILIGERAVERFNAACVD